VARYVAFQEVELTGARGGGPRVATLRLKDGEGPFAAEVCEEREGSLLLATARVRRL
jgi:hypothetical protein